MLDNIRSIVKLLREDWITTTCSVAFIVASLIVNTPELVNFAGSIAPTIVQISDFVQKASIAIGLAFAAQSKTKDENDLFKKDVVPEVLMENQHESKEDLMANEAKQKSAPKKKVSKASSIKLKSKTKP